MGKVFIVKRDDNSPSMPPQQVLDGVSIIIDSHQDIIALLEEIGYEQRPDSSATSVRQLIEELLADILDMTGHEYTGSAKYEIKRLLRQHKEARRNEHADIQ